MAGALRKAGEAVAELRRLGAAVSERSEFCRSATARPTSPWSFSPRPLAFWFFSAREKNRRPAMEACPGSMLRSGASCFIILYHRRIGGFNAKFFMRAECFNFWDYGGLRKSIYLCGRNGKSSVSILHAMRFSISCIAANMSCLNLVSNSYKANAFSSVLPGLK